MVRITNNMIDNNVSGWAGGGISAADALHVLVENNTIANNDSVGIVGTMIGTDPLGTGKVLGNTTGYPSPAGVSVDRTTTTLLTGMNARNAAANQYANVALYNDVLWHNRSFFFAITQQAGAATPTNALCPSNSVGDAYALNCTPLPPQNAIGQCVGNPAYWDIGTTDDASAAPASNALKARLEPTYSVLSSVTGYPGNVEVNGTVVATNNATDPAFAQAYCNGARVNPAFIFEPGQPFLTPAAQNLTAGATLDEAGNYVDVRFGPLYLFDPTTSTTTSPGTVIGDYHLAGPAGGAYNVGGSIAGRPATLAHDIDGDIRPQNRGTGSGVDIGADEYLPPGPQVTIDPAAAGVGAVQTGQSASASFTIMNTGTATPGLIVSAVTSSNPFFSTSNTCPSAGLAVGATCVVTVTFAPTGAFAVPKGTPQSATLTVTSNAVNGVQSVAVSGTAMPPSASASPGNFGNAETGVTTPETVTVTNNGVGPWTFANAVVTGAGWTLGSGGTCATAGSLAVGGTCTVVVNVKVPANGDGNTYQGTLVFSESALRAGTAALMQTVTQNFALRVDGRSPQAGVTPGTLQFGTIAVNTTGGPLTSTLTNRSGGGVSLTFNSGDITLGGANPVQFAITNTCVPGVVAASCTISATFTPTSAGSKSATITVKSGGTRIATVNLTGTGG